MSDKQDVDVIKPPIVPGPSIEDWLRTPDEETKDPDAQTEKAFLRLPDDHTRPGR
jgi:hypothetical protein